MRYGIISDVHGNIDALEQVLAMLREESIDEYICLGDVVGYGAEPEACCQIIRELTSVTILGNHDAAVAGRMDYSYYYEAARQALDLHREWISEQTHAWLAALPYSQSAEDGKINFCHGSPINLKEFDYVFALEQALSILEHYDELSHVTFIGHSHLTKSFELTADDAMELEGPGFDLDPDKKYLITVGSVGQPRDHDSRACSGVYDSDANRFEFRRTEYDVGRAADRILDCGLAQAFAKRLFLGV